jgi:hypothetical protein
MSASVEGMQTWTCAACGEHGPGDFRELNKHLGKHPEWSSRVAKQLARLSHGLERLAYRFYAVKK